MVEPINLRRARKAKARVEHTRQGAANRATFGQSKTARELNQAQTALQIRKLDAHRQSDTRNHEPD